MNRLLGTFVGVCAGLVIVALFLDFLVIPPARRFTELALGLFPLLFLEALGITSETLVPQTTSFNFLLLPKVG